LITFGLIVVANMVSGVKSVPLLVLGRVLMGIGVSGTGVFALTIVVHHFAKRQAGWISVIHGLMAASGGLGLAFARPLAERFGDWTYVYWLIAALAAVPTVALLLTPCREPVGGEPFELRGVVQAARHPALWPIALVLISYIIAEGATATYFAALMEHRRGLDPVVSVRLTAVFWIGVVLGRVSILALSHVMREKTLILVGAVVGGATLVIAAFAWPMAAAGVCLFVGGFLIGPVAPVAVSLAVARIGRFKPAVLAMTNLMMCVGGLIGPMAVARSRTPRRCAPPS
jgi:fucose permease